MPRPALKQARLLVRDHCETLDVPYTETTLLRSYGIVVRYLNRVGPRRTRPPSPARWSRRCGSTDVGVERISPLHWSSDDTELWTATDDAGAFVGSVITAGDYTAVTFDGSVRGTHHSLEAAQDQIDAWHRWNHQHLNRQPSTSRRQSARTGGLRGRSPLTVLRSNLSPCLLCSQDAGKDPCNAVSGVGIDDMTSCPQSSDHERHRLGRASSLFSFHGPSDLRCAAIRSGSAQRPAQRAQPCSSAPYQARARRPPVCRCAQSAVHHRHVTARYETRADGYSFLLVPGSRCSSSWHLWCAYSSAVPSTGTGWGKGADSPARIREEVLRGNVACDLEGVLRRWLQQDRDRRSEHELHRHR